MSQREFDVVECESVRFSQFTTGFQSVDSHGCRVSVVLG